MRNIFLILLASLLALPVFPQQKQAREVLDQTASAFRKAGGIKAEFAINVSLKGRPTGETSGVIQLKGEKFMLKTPDASTWFDGKTQWSYLTGSDEVNISTPTEDELQQINPYALLSIYQKGFSYTLGNTKSFSGKPVYEVILSSTDRKQDITRLVLYVTKDAYQPVYIAADLKDGSQSRVTVTNYQSGLTYGDSLFVFDKKQYPNAEIIDLR